MRLRLLLTCHMYRPLLGANVASAQLWESIGALVLTQLISVTPPGWHPDLTDESLRDRALVFAQNLLNSWRQLFRDNGVRAVSKYLKVK